MLPFQVVQTQVIAQAGTFDGKRVTVRKVQFNQTVPGIGNEGYAVDVADQSGAGMSSVGFRTQDEAMQYLTANGPKDYTVVDAMGNQQKETRVGLGIPQGMVSQLQANPTAPNVPVVPTVVPPNAAQHPNTAAALNAPSDANRPQRIASEQSFNAPEVTPAETYTQNNQLTFQSSDAPQFEDAPLA